MCEESVCIIVGGACDTHTPPSTPLLCSCQHLSEEKQQFKKAEEGWTGGHRAAHTHTHTRGVGGGGSFL